MKYTDPTLQALSDNMHANVQSAQSIIDNMKATYNQQRRESDKVEDIKPEQSARILANQGKHVYGSSHPLYKG